MFATHADKPTKPTRRQLSRKAAQERREKRRARNKAVWRSR